MLLVNQNHKDTFFITLTSGSSFGFSEAGSSVVASFEAGFFCLDCGSSLDLNRFEAGSSKDGSSLDANRFAAGSFATGSSDDCLSEAGLSGVSSFEVLRDSLRAAFSFFLLHSTFTSLKLF